MYILLFYKVFIIYLPITPLVTTCFFCYFLFNKNKILIVFSQQDFLLKKGIYKRYKKRAENSGNIKKKVAKREQKDYKKLLRYLLGQVGFEPT